VVPVHALWMLTPGTMQGRGGRGRGLAKTSRARPRRSEQSRSYLAGAGARGRAGMGGRARCRLAGSFGAGAEREEGRRSPQDGVAARRREMKEKNEPFFSFKSGTGG
jgi:hypothetical protein